MAPGYAYSFAPDIMNCLATKFQYLALPRLAIEAKLTRILLFAFIPPAPIWNGISNF